MKGDSYDNCPAWLCSDECTFTKLFSFQTMTFAQFQKIHDRDEAIKKLERIAISNLHNCLRLLKHNKVHDIRFFRFSSRLIPLAIS